MPTIMTIGKNNTPKRHKIPSSYDNISTVKPVIPAITLTKRREIITNNYLLNHTINKKQQRSKKSMSLKGNSMIFAHVSPQHSSRQ